MNQKSSVVQILKSVPRVLTSDMAHIREQHRLSLQSYVRPRMTEELQELGLSFGHGRVGRLMRENGIKVVRAHKYKATTDSDHTSKRTRRNLLSAQSLIVRGKIGLYALSAFLSSP